MYGLTADTICDMQPQSYAYPLVSVWHILDLNFVRSRPFDLPTLNCYCDGIVVVVVVVAVVVVVVAVIVLFSIFVSSSLYSSFITWTKLPKIGTISASILYVFYLAV